MEPPHLVRRSPDWTRWIVGGKAAQGRAASPSQMGRFETQWLAAPANLSAGRQPIDLGWRAAFSDWRLCRVPDYADICFYRAGRGGLRLD